MRALPVLLAVLLAIPTCPAVAAAAERLRVAVFNVEMDRRGPGILLRDILEGEDPQIAAVAGIVAHADPDMLLLTRFDWDHDLVALRAFADILAARGAVYPHLFARRPNAGRPTGFDLDDDGLLGGARDAQGYGRFAGQNGMALLSRLPIDVSAARDFSDFLWRDLPGATLPVRPDGTPFPSTEAQAIQRLSSVAHWDVPVILPDGGRLHLWAFHATPPVFDGPEDANGLRNRDELRFWHLYLDGAMPWPPAAAPFVLLGTANVDPTGGDGLGDAIEAFLADPRITDPRPSSPGATAAGARPASPLDTVAWDAEGEPGNLRVDYVLPAASLRVVDAGVVWPAPGPEAVRLLGEDGRAASRHRLVWVDLALP